MNRDLLFMLSATALSCLGAGLLGWLTLRLVRRRSLTVSLVVVALVPVLAIVVAVGVNVQAMFLSSHDAEVITVVVGTAAVLAIAVGIVLGRRISASSQALGQGIRDLAQSYESGRSRRARHRQSAAPLSAELAALAAQLEEARASLAESRERERAMEVGRRELIAAMSHDLRSPLAAIRALAEGLEDGVIDEKAALNQLRANVARMTGMVDDLLELSRLQGRQERPQVMVSLSEVMEDVVTEARPYAASRGVDVTVSAPERLPVRGDGDELARAVSNLVSNAVRHTSSGSVVEVRGSLDSDGKVGLEVADACGGIPDQHLSRLFDIGWRGDPERTPGGDSGAGLGLAIVRGVVESHGGTVGVRNDNGGCRFTVSLPAASH